MEVKRGVAKYIILYMILCVIINPSITVYALEQDNNDYYEIGYGSNIYTFQDLLTKYEANSTTYQRNMLDYQIQALTATISDESYEGANRQYLDIVQKIAELNETKAILISNRDILLSEGEEMSIVMPDGTLEYLTAQAAENNSLISEINSQIASVEAQISQYISNSNSLKINVVEAKLQEDIADFYSDYQTVIIQEAQNRLKNDLLKNTYLLMVYKEQLDYNVSYQTYLDLVRQADTIKFKLGMITQVDLDADNANIYQNSITITENQNLYDTLFFSIKNATSVPDNTKIRLSLSIFKKQYDVEATTNQFIINNSSIYQLQNYIKSYQNYLGSAGTSNNTSYQQTDLKIRNYQLQKIELENNIRAYVKKAIKSYELAFLSRETARDELQVKINLYNAVKTKLEYKRASQLQLQQALYEKEAAEISYYQSCYEIAVWQDILDHNLYGNTP